MSPSAGRRWATSPRPHARDTEDYRMPQCCTFVLPLSGSDDVLIHTSDLASVLCTALMLCDHKHNAFHGNDSYGDGYVIVM